MHDPFPWNSPFFFSGVHARNYKFLIETPKPLKSQEYSMKRKLEVHKWTQRRAAPDESRCVRSAEVLISKKSMYLFFVDLLADWHFASVSKLGRCTFANEIFFWEQQPDVYRLILTNWNGSNKFPPTQNECSAIRKRKTLLMINYII